MGLFRALVNIVTLPLAVVADTINVMTGEETGSTEENIKDLIEETKEMLE